MDGMISNSRSPKISAQQQYILMMKNLLINLPEDLFITNILLSKVLPIESLLSLKCVCTYLRNLITSPAFINMQISKKNNNNNNQLVLIKSTYRPNVFFSLKFNDGDSCRPEEIEFVSPIECPDIWGSCNGLVCLSNRNDVNTVCLWNPVTKEYKVLPPPIPTVLEIPIGNVIGTQVLLDIQVGSITYGFGYDRLLNDYKVIRCSTHFVVRYNDYKHGIPITEFQVYTLGANKWRKIGTDNNPYNKYYFVFSILMKHKPVVLVNGALHWIMSTSDWFRMKTSERTEAKIVSFDIEKEVFQEIQTPLMAKFKPDLCFCPVVQVLRGCLCVLEVDSNNETLLNVWMMMDYGVKESWIKSFTILRTEVSPYMMAASSYRLLRFCENGTHILMESYSVILVYDTVNNKARHVEFGEKFGECTYQSEIYIESLASLNSSVYKGEMKNSNRNRVS